MLTLGSVVKKLRAMASFQPTIISAGFQKGNDAVVREKAGLGGVEIVARRSIHRMHTLQLATTLVLALSTTLNAAPATSGSQSPLPREANGKPNLQGIWQASTTAGDDLQDHVASLDITAGRSVLTDGGAIPYQPSASRQREENFRNRAKLDPLNKCYIPGVPRVMSLDYPFQIFQTATNITMAFEWELDYRNIYLDGSKHREKDDDSWMGDSRGHWEGDTLVVDVTNLDDRTWLDHAGNYHSDALHVVERYTLTDPDHVLYEATIEDPKVFTGARQNWGNHAAVRS